MNGLYLISIGLSDEKDMSIRAMERARECDALYAELYTTKLDTNVEKLSQVIGKPVIELKRKDMEEESERILEEAKTKKVGVLVGGDCLTATTHTSLLEDAKRRRIPTKVIHGSSIYTAICETGLFIYKFGKTATIPLNGKLGNVKETVKSNKKLGLHALLLLDLDKEASIFLTVKDALKMLLKEKIIKETDELIAFSKAGEESKIYYDTVKGLSMREIPLPAVLIIPGKLHFKEKDFLEVV
jgi:diphthine synthase